MMPISLVYVYKFLLYKAHYLRETEKLDAALAALKDSHRFCSRTPFPLFLVAEWLIEARQNQKAGAYAERALVLVRKIIVTIPSL